jgi:hypothetical protein
MMSYCQYYGWTPAHASWRVQKANVYSWASHIHMHWNKETCAQQSSHWQLERRAPAGELADLTQPRREWCSAASRLRERERLHRRLEQLSTVHPKQLNVHRHILRAHSSNVPSNNTKGQRWATATSQLCCQ